MNLWDRQRRCAYRPRRHKLTGNAICHCHRPWLISQIWQLCSTSQSILHLLNWARVPIWFLSLSSFKHLRFAILIKQVRLSLISNFTCVSSSIYWLIFNFIFRCIKMTLFVIWIRFKCRSSLKSAAWIDWIWFFSFLLDRTSKCWNLHVIPSIYIFFSMDPSRRVPCYGDLILVMLLSV